MKTKSLKLAVILFLGLTVFDSCKKGENDPAISLRSRDARLTGEWKLVELERNATSTSTTTGFGAGSNTNSETRRFDGTTMTITTSGGSNSFTYSKNITIEKDGTYTLKVTSATTGNSDSYEEKGRWSWLSDAKNKTRILVDGLGVYTIDQLKNSEMIWLEEFESTDVDVMTIAGQTSTTTTVDRFSEKSVFEKQ